MQSKNTEFNRKKVQQGSQTLKQVIQKGCEVSILEDI